MKPIRTSDDHDLGVLLRAIADDMVLANVHWRLYQDLCSSILKFTQELNQARTFWSLTISAHHSVTLWHLGRLYDHTPGALSLPNLLATIRSNVGNFEGKAFRKRLRENQFVDSLAAVDRRPSDAQMDDDIRLVSKVDPLVDAFVNLRNKHLGHRDSRVALGRIEVPELDGTHVATLLERARVIVNRYSYLYRAETHSVEMVGRDDYWSVLNSVRQAIEASEAAIEREIEESEGRG